MGQFYDRFAYLVKKAICPDIGFSYRLVMHMLPPIPQDIFDYSKSYEKKKKTTSDSLLREKKPFRVIVYTLFLFLGFERKGDSSLRGQVSSKQAGDLYLLQIRNQANKRDVSEVNRLPVHMKKSGE